MQYLYKKSENKKEAQMIREIAKDEEDIRDIDVKYETEVEHAEVRR